MRNPGMRQTHNHSPEGPMLENLKEIAKACRCQQDGSACWPSAATLKQTQLRGVSSQWQGASHAWRGLATQGQFTNLCTTASAGQADESLRLRVQRVDESKSTGEKTPLIPDADSFGPSKPPRVHKRQKTGPVPIPPTLAALKELLEPTAAIWVDINDKAAMAEVQTAIRNTQRGLISLGVINSDNTTNFRIPKYAEIQRYATSASFEDRFPKPLAFAVLLQQGFDEAVDRKTYVLAYGQPTMDLLTSVLSSRYATPDKMVAACAFNLQETLRYFAIDRPSDMLYVDAIDLAVLAWVLDSAAGSVCYDIDHLKTVYGGECVKERTRGPTTLQESHPWRMLIEHDLSESTDLVMALSTKIKNQEQDQVTVHQELPVASVLTLMSVTGSPFDQSVMQQWRSDLTMTLAKLEREAQALVKKEVLSMMMDQHPVISLIRKHRQVAKLISTYVDTIKSLPESTPRPGLIEYFRPRAEESSATNFLSKNRLYTVWNQTMTVTGRLSSSSPNLQNIPKSQEFDDLGVVSLRKAFVAPMLDSHCLVSVDYRQVEIRVLAHFVGIGELQKSFAVPGADIYNNMAAMILRKRADQVTKTERNKAKVCCLALIYGSGIQLLARQMGVTATVAQGFKRQFGQAFPELERWMWRVWNAASKDGYVETLCRRRRKIDVGPDGLSNEAKRFCINSVIQGSAADIMKSSMVQIARALDSVEWKHGRPQLLLSIHDEFVLSCHIDDVKNLGRLLIEEMQNPALPGCKDHFSVPLEGTTAVLDSVFDAYIDIVAYHCSSLTTLHRGDFSLEEPGQATEASVIFESSPDTDPPVKRDVTYVLDRPTARGSRILLATKWVMNNNPGTEFLIYLDDDSFLSLPRLIPHLLELSMAQGRMLVMGYLMSTPLDVSVSGLDICDMCKPCQKCLDDESFRDFCRQFNLSLGACLHYMSTCQIYGSDDLAQCVSESLFESQRIVEYFGSRWTPTWPLGMGWVLGSAVADFISRNADMLKSRGAADVQIGYWLAGLEGIHWLDMSDGRFHDFPRRHSMFTRGCSDNTVLVHRMRPENWQAYDDLTCALNCPSHVGGEVEPS
ncbi:hypothetical protein FOL47_008662 [Perkinsus chesapeaki]|uniref:DNA-directed DNA polymerase n=1 Tax=Perkinsus chesapeaki TaxID=330153 RepID=A0A7J6LCQ0_PERCH|nr:hypothetical protein FOL47_008662 [Perkinsus chesapeaki]